MQAPKIYIALNLCLFASWWSVGSTPAHASDHDNLEEGLPITVEDAYPVAYRGKEFQGMLRYERTDDNKNRFVLEPRFEWGFARNWQAKVAVPFKLGSADKTGSGDISLELLHNFNTESLSTPAFAISARADLPTGKNSKGVDTILKFITTKTLGTGSRLQRLHLNLAWKRNASPRPTERDNRYEIVVGYSQRLGPDTMLVADYVREQEREAGKTSNIVELGIRRQLTPLRVFAIGVGAGLGSDSPDFRITTALQQTF